MNDAPLSSRLLRAIVQHGRDVVYVFVAPPGASGTHTITFVSDRVAPVLGYRADDCWHWPPPWLQHVHPDDAAAAAAAMDELSQSGRPGLLRYRTKRPNSGEYVWVEDHRIPVGGDDGPAEWVGVLRDVTELVALETALSEAEARHAHMIEASPYAILIVDADGYIAACNEHVRSCLGYFREELIGSPVDRVIPQALQERTVAGCRDLVESLRLRSTTQGCGVTAQRKDGSMFAAELIMARVEDATGRPVMRCVVRDVTQHSDEALRRSEERYRRLFEDALTGNFVSGPDGRILICNAPMATLLGFTSTDAAKGANWLAQIDAQDTQDLLARVRARRGVERHPLILQRQGGPVVRLIANVVGAFTDGGELFELHGQLVDDTQRYEIEQQLRQAQKMGAIGLLAGGIAHDFNNQLTAILGFTELLTGQIGPDKPLGKDLQQISQAAQHAAALTRQLLAFSRRQVLTLAVLDINEIVRDVRGVIGRVLGEQITVTTSLAESAHPVLADAQQLGQVLMNLCLNARDAMGGDGQLTIETLNVDLDAEYARANPGTRPGSYVRVRVRDTGTGMSPDVRARLFEPFFTTKERGKGTGLGLAVVHGIVTQLGGHVGVDSTPGQGSTFDVYLPRTEGQAAPVSANRAAAPSVPGHETILLVEDEASVRAFAKISLTRFGYRVLEASSAEAALALLDRRPDPIHLLLTDVILPAMDGHALYQHIRRRQAELPVLFMSGYVGDHEKIQRVLGSSVRLLEKPFTAQELLGRVRALLDTNQPAFATKA